MTAGSWASVAMASEIMDTTNIRTAPIKWSEVMLQDDILIPAAAAAMMMMMIHPSEHKLRFCSGLSFHNSPGSQSHSVSKTLDISTKMGCWESFIRSSALSRSKVFLWRKYHLTHSWIDIAFLFQATWSKNQSYFVAVQRASSWRQLCWQVLDHWSVVVLETFPGIEEKLGKKGWRLFLCSSSTSAAAQFPWLECVSATFLRHAENDVERSSSSSSLPAQKQLEVHNSSL